MADRTINKSFQEAGILDSHYWSFSGYDGQYSSNNCLQGTTSNAGFQGNRGLFNAPYAGYSIAHSSIVCSSSIAILCIAKP